MSWPLLPPSYERQLGHARRVELADDRRIRERNKVSYRLSHWPIWIFVFFIAPGPLTFDLFNHGFDRGSLLWLGLVLARDRHRRPVRQAAGRRAAALHHPLHRGPSEPALPADLLHAGVERGDRVRRAQHRRPRDGGGDRRVAAPPDVRGRLLSDRHHGVGLGALGLLPRVKPSTQGEGHERRYFYGSVWAVCIAQPILWVLWKALPHARWADAAQARRLRRRSWCMSAIWPASACCRAPGRSFRASWPSPTERRPRTRPAPGRANGWYFRYDRRMSTIDMDEKGVILNCPSCGQRNRVPYGHDAKCGHCGTMLPAPGEPIEVPTRPRSTRSSRPPSCRWWSISGRRGAARAAWWHPSSWGGRRTNAGTYAVVKVNTDAIPELGDRFAHPFDPHDGGVLGGTRGGADGGRPPRGADRGVRAPGGEMNRRIAAIASNR